MTEQQEARLIGRAIRARWPIPDVVKTNVILELARIATEGEKEASRVAASRAIIAAEAQNQKDEESEAEDFRRRIIEIAQRCGIRIDLLRIGEATRSGAGPSNEADPKAVEGRAR